MKEAATSGSVFMQLRSLENVTLIVSVGLVIIMLIALVAIFNIRITAVLSKILRFTVKKLGRLINIQETKYHRDIAIGKITEKIMKVRIYRFLNDLIIDLGLKKQGVTPYEFLFIVVVGSAIVNIIACQIIFNSLFISIPLYPIMLVAIVCGLYTKSNIAHDLRIEAIIESENIISNNIREGVIVAIRNSIESIPSIVRMEFKELLDNVDHKNFHPRTALLELANSLGSTSDHFIKSCIGFEMEEEHGQSEMFQDIVEINHIKTDLRTEMKRMFETVTTEFTVSALMIFMFLGGVIVIFPTVSNFYFHNTFGQIIIGIDLLIIVAEFVFITYLRARDL